MLTKEETKALAKLSPQERLAKVLELESFRKEITPPQEDFPLRINHLQTISNLEENLLKEGRIQVAGQVRAGIGHKPLKAQTVDMFGGSDAVFQAESAGQERLF